MIKVVLISGKAGSGKDTVAKMLKRRFETDGKRVIIAHFGDLVKYVAKTFYQWNGEKDEEGRHLLQKIGTDIVRNVNPDYWVNFMCDFLTFFGDDYDVCIIPDLRFPNELEVLRVSGFNTVHIDIYRPDYVTSLTEAQQQHASETSMNGVIPDIQIINDSTLYRLEKESYTVFKQIETGDM